MRSGGTAISAQAWTNSSSGDVARFGFQSGDANPYAVTLSQATSANGIIFQDQAYTLSGSTLTLVGTSPTITVYSVGGGTINSVLAGTGGLTSAGTGMLVLGGANTSAAGPASAPGP